MLLSPPPLPWSRTSGLGTFEDGLLRMALDSEEGKHE
jgi:hypothetical protein